MWCEQATIERSWYVNSIVGCCYSAKLRAHAARVYLAIVVIYMNFRVKVTRESRSFEINSHRPHDYDVIHIENNSVFLLSSLCHPGPCPQCPAMIDKECKCRKVTARVRCSQQDTLSCNQPCGKFKNCGLHKCEEICHGGQCKACDELVEQSKLRIFTIYVRVLLRRFRDPIRVPRISNWVPRIREIGSLQIHIGYLTFSLKKTCFTLLR